MVYNQTKTIEGGMSMNQREQSSCELAQVLQGIGLTIILFLCLLLFGGMTPLFAQRAPDDALTKEKLNMLKEALESGMDVNQRDEEGKTPLMGAAEDGDVAVVQYMVEHGARVNDQYGAALMLALSHAHSDVVKYLLEHGADLNLMLALLNGPTVSAFSKHYLFTSFCLLEPDALSVAFAKGLTESDRDYIWSQCVAGLRNIQCKAGAMRLFLERGEDANKDLGDGSTALMNAAGAGRLDLVKILIQKGADVNARNKRGVTPLKAAVNAPKDKDTIIAALRKAGARE
jgi:ankyrin repeat protein